MPVASNSPCQSHQIIRFIASEDEDDGGETGNGVVDVSGTLVEKCRMQANYKTLQSSLEQCWVHEWEDMLQVQAREEKSNERIEK